MSFAINTLVISGNLTRDPELKKVGETTVCEVGMAHNIRFKDSSGQWTSRACFFDLKVWGAQGESLAQHAYKGMAITVHGHLDQRSWEAQDGSKRSKVEIVGEDLIYDSRDGTNRPAAAAATPQGHFDDDFDL